jgi:uncharacterized protein YdeI (YjbR/CyaY-like superfamily)
VNVGKKLYVKDRRAWRAWLAKHHAKAAEIWLVYYKKASGKPRIPYSDAVEEALCYGWIDSITKPLDEHSWAQRWSPRKPKSQLSPMNLERVRRLIKARRMTKAGLARIAHVFDHREDRKARAAWTLPKDIERRLKADPVVWKNYQRFPKSYQHIRIGWIVGGRRRREVFEQRLRYFIKMTAQNKRFGMVQ